MFIEIAEAHPRFLRRQLPAVVDAMLQARRVAGCRAGCAVAGCDVSIRSKSIRRGELILFSE